MATTKVCALEWTSHISGERLYEYCYNLVELHHNFRHWGYHLQLRQVVEDFQQ
jgi:hypothetical protein